jgi:phenylalanyl-tRNA synthetase beta chain
MKASYTWIRSLVPGLTASARELADRFTAAGLEVEGVHEYGAASASCVVAKVVSTRPHPTKSGLTLVTVDRGGPTQEVVCGAPNVPPPGGLVVLAPLGATLPAKGVTIERRTIAGVVSEGMLCSESELGLTDESGGILILPDGVAKAGTPLASAIPEAHDAVFEIGLTPNRPDGLGHIGLAREAAALYGIEWSRPAARVGPCAPGGDKIESLASVKVLDAARCPRYGARAVTGVKIAASPLWLRYRLSALGVRPISNVVDVTNLLLLEYGHPMHAFDLDRVRGAGSVRPIVVRRAAEGEALTTLDGAPHTLTQDDLVIADAEGPVALAGVMGGKSSEISSGTTRVLLECAMFEPRGVRRASRRHGLHTDSSHRFERGVDPSDTRDVLERASELLVTLAGGKAAEGVIDVTGEASPETVVTLRSQRLDALLGVAVPWGEALAILGRLGFVVRTKTASDAKVVVPPHRPDVTREVDLIEEVARVRGMDAIPAVLPRIRPSREAAPREDAMQKARAAAVALGLSEAITYSFVSRAALENVSAPPAAVVLKNPLSVEQEVMRTSLLPGLLSTVSHAERHGERDVAVFSVGATFLSNGGRAGLPEERLDFAALLGGERARYLRPSEPVDVWDAKGVVEGLVRRLAGRASLSIERLSGADVPPHLHPRGAARVVVEGRAVGTLGPLHPDVPAHFEVAAAVVVVELDLLALLSVACSTARYAPIPRFPANRRDLSVVVGESVPAGDVQAAVLKAAGALATEVALFDRFVGGSIPPGHHSLAFHVVYRALDRTLTDAEVDAQHDKAAVAVREQFGATLRG